MQKAGLKVQAPKRTRPGWSLTHQEGGLHMALALSFLSQLILVTIPLMPPSLLPLPPMGFPLRALGCGVWTQMLWSFLKLLLRCFKVLLAHLWLSQCVCCINKSRSSNREDVSNLRFINRKSSLLRAWAFRLRGQGLSLASTTYLIDQVNFSEPQCYSLYMCPPHPIFICRSPNRQSDDICWWSHWEVISFRWGYFFSFFLLATRTKRKLIFIV